MMDTTCMGFSSSNGMNREEASGAFFEALGDPLFDLHRVPAHRAHAQAQRLGELAFLHQAVDVRALEAGLGFDLGAAQDAVLGDRKSVVSGKRVSVRVDLGGRRNLKKKQDRVNKE